MLSKYSYLYLVGITPILFSACDIWKEVRQGLGLSPESQTSPSPVLSPSPRITMTEEEYSSAAARNAKANAEILQEVIRVVYMREPTDRGEFGNWVDTLNQGASLEGVYNGLTHSSDYRKMEAIHTGATPEALRLFGEELALLEAELPVPTVFDAASAAPLAYMGGGGFSDPNNPSDSVNSREPASVPSAEPSSKLDPKTLADQYTKQFIGSSIFTLKRVLGDEALKVIATKMQYREKLALWYSRWVVRLAQRNVDFGVSLRNKPDEAFHYKWAVESPEDRVKWEVLNRLHRLLNDANRQKQ